ncbi:MAG: F0F1 ATP synthase subunit A [Myxococcota bacterium]
MKTWGVLTAAMLATGAFASGGEGEHGESVPDYILHHVSDDSVYEFEIPAPFYTGHNPHIDLAKTFHFLQFELKPGACSPTPVHGAGLWSELFAGCIDLRPTKHVLMMWIGALLLLVALLTGTHRDKTKLVPHGVGKNFFEILVLFVRDEIAIKNIGKEEGPRYTPYLLTAFFFILFMNLLGLVPFMATATGNLAITAGLATCTFVITQLAGIRAAGLGGYLKHLTGGVHWALWPIMVPVEVLGLFTKPFALTVRLFANMLAGHVVLFFILALIFLLHGGMAVVSVPMAVGIYMLELFVAFVQAYVFTMLSALFIGMSVAMGHHHDEEHHTPEGAHAHGS